MHKRAAEEDARDQPGLQKPRLSRFAAQRGFVYAKKPDPDPLPIGRQGGKVVSEDSDSDSDSSVGSDDSVVALPGSPAPGRAAHTRRKAPRGQRVRQAPKVRQVSRVDLGCGDVSAEQAIQAAAASARTPQQKPAPASRGDELDLHFEPGELEELFEESGLESLNYTVDDGQDPFKYNHQQRTPPRTPPPPPPRVTLQQSASGAVVQNTTGQDPFSYIAGLRATRVPHPVAYPLRAAQAHVAAGLRRELTRSEEAQTHALESSRAEIKALENLYDEECDRRRRLEGLFQQARDIYQQRVVALEVQINHLSQVVAQYYAGYADPPLDAAFGVAESKQ